MQRKNIYISIGVAIALVALALVYTGIAGSATCLAGGVFIEDVKREGSICSIRIKNCYDEEATVPLILEAYEFVEDYRPHWSFRGNSMEYVVIEPKTVKTVGLGCGFFGNGKNVFNFVMAFNKTAYQQCTYSWMPYPDCPGPVGDPNVVELGDKCRWGTHPDTADWSTFGCTYADPVPGSGTAICGQFKPKDCFEDWRMFE